MSTRWESVLGSGAGLVATLLLGVSVLLAGVEISPSPLVTALWWAAYVVYVAAFVLDDLILRDRPWRAGATVAVLFVTGMAVWLLAPDLGWSALLFVVTTAVAAFALAPVWVVGIVVVNSVAIAAGTTLAGWDTPEVAVNTLAYLALQSFAAIVVTSARRESEARIALAAAHAELRATTALLDSTSRSAERLRIARDLHDVVGHQLTALALELEVAAHRTTGEGHEHVTRARDIAKDLLGDVRATVGRLRETPTELEPVLRAIVTGLPGLSVDLSVDESVPLDEARRTAVVRWVQEVVTNALRHSRATRLVVSVASGPGGLELRAHDDGTGVETVEFGHGLTGMAERVSELNGELSVESGRGRGFTVLARVPAT